MCNRVLYRYSCGHSAFTTYKCAGCPDRNATCNQVESHFPRLNEPCHDCSSANNSSASTSRETSTESGSGSSSSGNSNAENNNSGNTNNNANNSGSTNNNQRGASQASTSARSRSTSAPASSSAGRTPTPTPPPRAGLAPARNIFDPTPLSPVEEGPEPLRRPARREADGPMWIEPLRSNRYENSMPPPPPPTRIVRIDLSRLPRYRRLSGEMSDLGRLVTGAA